MMADPIILKSDHTGTCAEVLKATVLTRVFLGLHTLHSQSRSHHHSCKVNVQSFLPLVVLRIKDVA